MEGKFVKTYDNSEIYLHSVKSKAEKAVCLLAHGMSDHGGRYAEFAEVLSENGISVYIPDHRAHGKTAVMLNNVGKTQGNGDIFDKTVRDLQFLAEKIREVSGDKKLIVMGHSYGSFLVQELLCRTQADLAIICGSGYFRGMLNGFGKLTANIQCALKGEDAPAKLIAKLSFESYNKKFTNGCWVSSIDRVRDEYNSDPYCSQIFSAGFYKYFFRNGLRLYNKKHRKSLMLPDGILLISGSDDPIGGYGKGVDKLEKFYIKQGAENIKKIIYSGARHEILNDFCKEQVYGDIIEFIFKNL